MTGKSVDCPVVLVGEGPARLQLHSGGIAEVRLNRPEAANGLNIDLLKALHDTLLQVHGDPRVRVMLLTAEGRNFCAGGDVHVFRERGECLPDYIRIATTYLSAVASVMIHLKVPVVAAVQGYAAGGGGMGLVCSCDIVVAERSSKFLAGATRVGMVPDAGVSVTLTQLVGFRKAMEILLLNPIISASEALELGLINRVVEDGSVRCEAFEIARQLAQGAPAALGATKRLLWNGLGRGTDACMPEENALQATLSGTADALEGLSAVIEKRAARFTGR
jgi:2-(1,2-epoxy-1,2-dihydrophenyl)acetyl-CoA isomerase